MFNVSKLLAVTEAWKFKGNRELISARNMENFNSCEANINNYSNLRVEISKSFCNSTVYSYFSMHINGGFS